MFWGIRNSAAKEAINRNQRWSSIFGHADSVAFVPVALVMAGIAIFFPVASAESTNSGGKSGAAIELTGGTRHPVLPEASVEVVFGSEKVVGGTDAAGRYSISINCDKLDAIVFVYVQGSGEQSNVRTSRVVDSCAALQENTNAENQFQVGLVSLVSTAAYAVLNWYFEDLDTLHWPPDAEELFNHRLSVPWPFASEAIVALSPLMLGRVPLPDSADTTLDVVLDRLALQAYTDDLFMAMSSEAIAEAYKAVMWDAGIYLPTERLLDLSSLSYYCPQIIRLCEVSFQTSAGQAYHSNGTQGGAAELIFRDSQDTVFNDQFRSPEDNLRAIRMTGANGEPLSELISFPWSPSLNQQIEQRILTEHADLRLLDASESLPLGTVNQQIRLTYPNGELPDEIRSGLPGLSNVSGSKFPAPVWPGPQPGESWHMPIHLGGDDDVASTRVFRWDRLTFGADGTGSSLLSGYSFQYGMNDGVLELDGPRIGPHRFKFLGGDLDRHPLFNVTYKLGTNEIVSETLSLVRDRNPAAFASETVPVRYFGGFDLDERNLVPSSGFPRSYIVFHLDTNGTGWRAFMEDPLLPGRPENSTDLTWTIDNHGRLIFERPVSNVFFRRAWLPMALHVPTGHLYVNELGPLIKNEPGHEFSLIPGRLNLYRRIEMP